MVTTKQKPIVDTQKMKRRESKTYSMKNINSQRKIAKGRKEWGNYEIARTQLIKLHQYDIAYK